MAKSGRKSYLEEMQIKERYTALSEPFFRVLKKYLNSEIPDDEKWAVEQLNKAYVKMIPQDMTSGGKELPTPLINVFSNISNSEGDGDAKKD